MHDDKIQVLINVICILYIAIYIFHANNISTNKAYYGYLCEFSHIYVRVGITFCFRS